MQNTTVLRLYIANKHLTEERVLYSILSNNEIQKGNWNSLSRNTTGCIHLLQVDLNGFPSERSESKPMDNIKPRDKLLRKFATFIQRS